MNISNVQQTEVGDEILSGGVWRREGSAGTTGQDAASAVPGWASCGCADGRGTWRLAEELPSAGPRGTH